MKTESPIAQLTREGAMRWAHLAYALAGGLLILLWNTFQTGSNLSEKYPTKLYVDAAVEQTKRYADDQARSAYQRSVEENTRKIVEQREAIFSKLADNNADLRVVNTKVEQILDTLREQHRDQRVSVMKRK